MNQRLIVTLSTTLSALACFQAHTAQACSPPLCDSEIFAPSAGHVPANLPAVTWVPAFRSDGDSGLPEVSTADDLTITCTLGAASRTVPFHVKDSPVLIAWDRAQLLYFDEPLIEGETCQITTVCHIDEHDVPSVQATYLVTAAAQLPSAQSLGAIKLTQTQWRSVPQGGCVIGDESECGAFVSVSLADALAPWSEAFVYQLNDYDERTPVALPYWLRDSGRTDARELSIEAWLPGMDFELSTNTVTAPIVCMGGPDAGVEPDAGARDASTMADASIAPRHDDSDCSCSAVGSASAMRSKPWVLTLALLVTAWRLLRRAQRSPRRS